MPTAYQNLITARDNVLTELAAMDSTTAGGKPNANGPHWVDHQGYRKTLLETLRELNEQIAAVRGPAVGVSLGRI